MIQFKKVYIRLILVLLALIAAEIFIRAAILTLSYSRKIDLNNKGDNVYKILCIGGSTTADGTEQGIDYPSQLQKLFNEEGKNREVEVINKGHANANSTWIYQNIESFIKETKPDLVISLFGRNDESIYGHPNLQTRNPLKIVQLLNHFYHFALSPIYQKLRYKFLSKNIKHNLNFLKTLHQANEILKNDISTVSISNIHKTEKSLLEYLKLSQTQKNNIHEYEISLTLGKIYEKYFLNYNNTHKYMNLALSIKPNSYEPILSLFMVNLETNNFPQAKKYLDQLEKTDIPKARLLLKKGIYYERIGEAETALKNLEESLKINPSNIETILYIGYALSYNQDEGSNEALQLFYQKYKKRFSTNLYFKLNYGRYNYQEGRFKEAERIFRSILTSFPLEKDAYYWLIGTLNQLHKFDEAKAFKKKIERIELKYPNYITMKNYISISKLIHTYNVKHIAMQYPLRSIKPLKGMLSSLKYIYYLSNIENFQKEIDFFGNEKVFLDNSAGDFGHNTEYGNHLLAKNIYDFIERKKFIPVKN